ncbi:MAG: DNA topoisomerase IV subunit A [Clostridium sp.]|nr:DNA topoisomerase IV subunit A [Clostridium sp.]MDY3827332.1 DNA topoisomerase IV subunit A [Clostridium sp.]
MAKKIDKIPKDNNIIPIPLEEAMPDNYLPYAVEVAKERALPDVRDGLKPVHRRILYGAYLLKAFPDRPYYKSARIVGDILGKFHPHGDSSVYDATVILAQDFSTREPLIDGHGNFGSIDGDGAAAMRYTEARLTNIAMEMLRDIDKDTVDMVPNYSDSEMEPKVLPSRYPNLLVNGTFGIAVGLATNIPPHNLNEVINGVLAYIDNNDITTKELMKYIKGPDLPTGGIIIGSNALLSAYETGEGKVTCRAKANIEKLENDRLGIVITEFPYKRNKAKLLQTISEMTGDKKHAKALESISDIRDESDRTGIRTVIELKKSVDEEMAEKVLKYLYKKTDLQCNISFNMVALSNGKPETMGLKTIIHHYVNHQKDIVTRRTRRELEIAEKRFHIVEGFIKAIGILDEVIKTIRESKSKKDAMQNLITKFDFTEAQAEAILELMLYRLTGLEITTFKKEYEELKSRIKRLKKILSDERELYNVIKDELKEIADKYKNPRRTKIEKNDDVARIDVEELIVVEDVIITVSKDGFIKRMAEKSYIRSNANAEDIEYREGDSLKTLLKSNTKDTLIIFTDKGNMYQTKVVNLPEGKWKDKGERIDTIIKAINLDDEKIVSTISVDSFSEDKYLHFVTSKGSIKKSSLDKFVTNYAKLQATKLRKDEKLIAVYDIQEEIKHISMKTKEGLSFTADIPELMNTQRANMGVNMFNISSNDEVVEAEIVEESKFVEFSVKVAQKHSLKVMKLNNRNEKLKVNTNSTSKLLLFTNKGNVIKIDSLILSGIQDSLIKISSLVDNFDETEKIVGIFSIKQFIENMAVYQFTKCGFVKKTSLAEFDGDFITNTSYKFKMDNDEVVSVDIASQFLAEVVIITNKSMAIKFSTESLSLMSKNASGVTGISIKGEDSVIYGGCFIDNSLLKITTKKKKSAEINIDDIKTRNRAGRGSSILSIELDDEIVDINN